MNETEKMTALLREATESIYNRLRADPKHKDYPDVVIARMAGKILANSLNELDKKTIGKFNFQQN